MSLMRSFLLAASQNRWLRDHASHYKFVRRSVSRFMPGETLDDALIAAQTLRRKKIGTVFTRLGENISDRAEAQEVTDHYLEVLKRVRQKGLATEISVKLTQLGLDLSSELCFGHLKAIIAHAPKASIVWIDMEASNYVDVTLDLYRRALGEFPNVGVCLQAYLRRTRADLESLLPMGAAIRIVKGAYAEPPEKAFPDKRDVEDNFHWMAEQLWKPGPRANGAWATLGTHDRNLINELELLAKRMNVGAKDYEYALLFGIQRNEQLRLVKSGRNVRVLISYGAHWFPWYMRRLAERPANLLFVARSMFS